MARELHLLTGTGIFANGKTTQLDIIAISIGVGSLNDLAVRAEMSMIIQWGSRLYGHLGDQVRKQMPSMARGYYLTDEVAIPLFKKWLESRIAVYPRMQTLIIGGIPRTKLQKEKILELFASAAIIDIAMDPDEAVSSAIERSTKMGAVARADDLGGQEVFENRKGQFMQHTLPMLNSLNGEGIRLKRSDPLINRTVATLHHIQEMNRPVMPPQVTRKALKRILRCNNHSVHREIDNVVSGRGITPGLIKYV